MVVKIPVGVEAAATKALSREGIDGTRRLVHRQPQGAARGTPRAPATSAPFVGSFDDIAGDGLDQLDDIVTAIQNYDFGHPVRSSPPPIPPANHVTQAVLMVADIATVPLGAMKKCMYHPLTEQGLRKFRPTGKRLRTPE